VERAAFAPGGAGRRNERRPRGWRNGRRFETLLSRFIDGWHGRLTLALVVYVGIVTAALSVRKDGPHQDLLRDLATLPISPSVALLAFGAAGAPGLDPKSRGAWRRLGAARIAYAAGDFFWFLDTALGRRHPPLSA